MTAILEADAGASGRSEAPAVGARTQHAAGRAHLAHAPEWAVIIPRSYGHTPLYFTAADAAGRTGVLPAFIVRRPLGGTIVSSMPYLDGGGPCSDSADISQHLVERLLHEAGRIGARLVDVRSAQPLDTGSEPRDHKVNMVLELPADPDRLWTGFDRAVRNQVRKAERAGLSVEPGGAEHLDAFYAVYTARMRDLGSPPHSREFFRAALEAFGDRARVVLVRKGPRAIGGLVSLSHDGTMTVPWASCLQEYFALCPNMLLYWETLRAASCAGLARFDFGRSTRGSGTYRFKRQWGASARPLLWYTVAVRASDRSPAGKARVLAPLAGIWRRLPLAWTRRLGPRIRKHLVQ